MQANSKLEIWTTETNPLKAKLPKKAQREIDVVVWTEPVSSKGVQGRNKESTAIFSYMWIF